MIFNYEFKNPELFSQALTHKSFSFENGKTDLKHNERLEFLGDAVIDLGLSDLLMSAFPEQDEGSLSKMRASLVNESVLSQIATEMGLAEKLRLGKGEKQSGGHKKPRLLASTYEALIGAVYLDSGYDTSLKLIREHFENRVAALSEGEAYSQDFKTRFQEILQARMKVTPTYHLVEEEGPSHNKKFKVMLKVKGRSFAAGEGKSKKQAEQMAAQRAIEKLEEQAQKKKAGDK